MVTLNLNLFADDIKLYSPFNVDVSNCGDPAVSLSLSLSLSLSMYIYIYIYI